jgi:hypothetical protein
VILVLIGCKDVTKTDTKEEQEKVRTLFTNWVKDLTESESADAYFKYVTDDFILMEAGADHVSDKEKMKADINSLFASNTFHIENWESTRSFYRMFHNKEKTVDQHGHSWTRTHTDRCQWEIWKRIYY